MKDLIQRLKEEWAIPKHGIHEGEQTMFKFKCQFNGAGVVSGMHLPHDVSEFLTIANGAELFKDSEYGQWGLRIFSIEEIEQENLDAREWQSYLIGTDLVIGNFLGDLDLLVVSTDDKSFGEIIIATPIDYRIDWYFLKMNFAEFIEKYADADGDKFWEALNYR